MIRTTARALILTAVVAGAVATMVPQSALAISNTPDNTGWWTSGKTYAFANDGSTVYVGGTFKKVLGPLNGRYAVANLAAFDMATGIWVSTFTPTVASSSGSVKISSLALSPDDSMLFIGGQFTSVDGQPAHDFGVVDTSTGALVQGFPSVTPNQPVDALLAGPSLLYLGGAFTKVNGETRAHLAAIGYDGTLSETWTPSTAAGNCPAPYYNANTCSNGGNGNVRSLALSADGSTVFVGGEFYYVDGTGTANYRNCIARVSATDGSLDVWNVNWSDVTDDASSHKAGPDMAWSIVPTITTLYVGFGRVPNYIQAFPLPTPDTSTPVHRLWIVHTPGNAESLALSPDGSTLYAGGHFGTATLDFQVTACGQNVWAHGLISLNAATGAFNCSWMPPLLPFGGQSAPGSGGSPNYVGGWAMFISGNALWIGGGFTSVNGVSMSGIARFTLSGSPPPPVPQWGGFSPTSGPAGTQVTITGFAFTGTTSVLVNGVGAAYHVVNDGTITLTVPATTTGPLTVVAPGGTVTSGAKKFHVT